MTSIKDYTTGTSRWLDKGNLHFKEHHLEELKALAYWERRTIKEVIDEALGLTWRGKKLPTLEKP